MSAVPKIDSKQIWAKHGDQTTKHSEEWVSGYIVPYINTLLYCYVCTLHLDSRDLGYVVRYTMIIL